MGRIKSGVELAGEQRWDTPSPVGPDYLFASTQPLATRNITSILTVESAGQLGHAFTREGISYLGDNLLLLEMNLGQELIRTIRVLNSRGSAHDGGRHPLSIGAGGVVMG